MHCVEFFLSGGCEDRPISWAFSRIYRSKLSIYLQNYVKNGLIFKTTNQKKKKKINTVHNLITFSIVFTNKNRGGGHVVSIITKVYLPLIIAKVKRLLDWSTSWHFIISSNVL